MYRGHLCINCITPPYILRNLLGSEDNDIRQAALNTLISTAKLRGERTLSAFLPFTGGDSRRTIFDCKNSDVLFFAIMARSEDGPVSRDDSVNRAFDGLGATRDFYKKILNRNSLDDRGMRLDGYVHRGLHFNNAFWDGRQMVFGDGDGKIFTDFTKSIDVIAHELTHGVTQHTANLEYHDQPGALNESISDVFGTLVKQWSQQQTADQADWLIGVEIFTPDIEGDALRSMKAPGTAYDNAVFGKDPQPDHMTKYVRLPDTEDGDNGGVHINSGIPNKAFYLTAISIGGFAWKAAGHIWYESLLASNPRSDFQDFADTTYLKAGQLYGAGGIEQKSIGEAWREVGIRVSGIPAREVREAAFRPTSAEESLAAMTKQLEVLSNQVKSLTKEVATLKGKDRRQPS